MNITKLLKYKTLKKSMLSSGKIKLKARIKKFIMSHLDFKPKDAKDYYGVGNLLVSRNLVKFIVMIVGVIGIYYFMFVSPINIFNPTQGGVRVFNYTDIILRFVNTNVKIKDANKDIAYEGYVSKGMANGSGILYYAGGEEKKLYEGEFKDNKYNGTGTQYYKSGLVAYSGGFLDNVRSGTGTSYRENGSREYSGEFVNGKPDGVDEYYSTSNNLVYTGTFSQGNLLYEDLLDKTAKEISSVYTGRSNVFYTTDDYLVTLNDINAMYYGNVSSNPLEDSITASRIYVASSECYVKGVKCDSISRLSEDDVLGKPVYEGNSYITVQELAMSEVFNLGLDGLLVLDYGSVDDVYFVVKDETVLTQLIYMYAFESEGISYTFYCTDRGDDFFMYEMQKVES
jgi:hypothetical protein